MELVVNMPRVPSPGALSPVSLEASNLLEGPGGLHHIHATLFHAGEGSASHTEVQLAPQGLTSSYSFCRQPYSLRG